MAGPLAWASVDHKWGFLQYVPQVLPAACHVLALGTPGGWPVFWLLIVSWGRPRTKAVESAVTASQTQCGDTEASRKSFQREGVSAGTWRTAGSERTWKGGAFLDGSSREELGKVSGMPPTETPGQG